MTLRKSKMAESVSAYITTVGDKINNQQEEKQQPKQPEQLTQPIQPIQPVQENHEPQANPEPQEKPKQQTETTSGAEPKPKRTQYRTPTSLITEQKQISLRLPIDIYDQIVKCSQEEYISMNTFIIKILDKELKTIQTQEQ